jgi:hypothetical protein
MNCRKVNDGKELGRKIILRFERTVESMRRNARVTTRLALFIAKCRRTRPTLKFACHRHFASALCLGNTLTIALLCT